MPLGNVGPFGHIRASKGSRIQVNGINMPQSDWRNTWRGEDVDTSNFESIGFEQGTIGFQVMEYQSNGLWNAQRNAYDSPPGIFPTDLLPNIFMFENVGDNVFHFLPFSRLLSCENSAQNLKTGAVAFNFSGKSNGGFSIATGSF